MSKGKTIKTKKGSSSRKFTQIFVVLILVVFVFYFVMSNLINNSPNVTEDVEKSMNNKTTFTFAKEGELAFTKPDGSSISSIDIEIADNDDQRATGMMFRTELKENQGMLFIFPYEAMQSFWMKNTVLSLDIIYVNSNMEIVKIHHNTKPFSEQSYTSDRPAQYVVEVNAGYSNKIGIKEGDKVLIKKG